MADCLLCRLLIPKYRKEPALLWQRLSEWDEYHSNEWDIWVDLPEEVKTKVDGAPQWGEVNPEISLQFSFDLANSGYASSMRRVAWHYTVGSGVQVDPDQAEKWYRRAIDSGSWMATLEYADFLDQQNRPNECDEVLADGLKQGWIPAYFWQAYYRYHRSSSRATCCEIRPLLEHAAAHGHPLASLKLSTMYMFGKFGLGKVLQGMRMLSDTAPNVRAAMEAGRFPDGEAFVPVPG